MLDKLFQGLDVSHHNKQERNIVEKSRYSLMDFLSNTNNEANLLICGGDAEIRAAILVNYIKRYREITDEALIVFSQNPYTNQLLVHLHDDGELGNYYSFSSCNDEKDYDFFSGMPLNNIVDFFKNLAQARGYSNVNDLDAYITAFISVLSSHYNLNLASMQIFSENSDMDIIDFAKNQGHSIAADTVQSKLSSRYDFLTLLQQFRTSVSSLTQDGIENKQNVINLVNQNECMMFIDTTSVTNTEIATLYFMEEMNCIFDKKFTVIFDDCLMTANSEFQYCLNKMKSNLNSTVVVSCENAVSVFDEENRKNFGRQIIYLSGSAPAQDTQELLSRFGNYDHQEIIESVGSKSESFGFFNNNLTNTPTTYKRDKIIYDEHKDCVVLSGIYESDVYVVRSFLID